MDNKASWFSAILVLNLISFASPASDFILTFTCPAGSGWKLIGTHCFNFIKTELDFLDSFDVCKKYGATLMNVRDEVEAKNISLEAKSIFYQDHYWISNGYSDVGDVSQAFINPNCSGYWQINEPSATGGRVAVASDMFGKWALKSVWIDLPFVCRAPSCPTNSFRCSNGMCLNQRWKCDNVSDCADGSDEIDCSGFPDCIKHYKSSNGTLNSDNGENCQWILEGVPGEVLSIYFESVVLMENAASVFVYSGGPTIQSSILVKELKGNSSRLSVFGINHFLIIRLRSYSSSLTPFVNATWKADQKLSKLQFETIKITHAPEIISTPYFGTSNLPSTYKRKWKLSTDIDSVITVEIVNSTMEIGSNEDSELVISPVSFVLHEPNTKRAIYISSSSKLTILARVNQQQNKYMTANIWKGCNFNTTLTHAQLELRDKLLPTECIWRVRNKLMTDFSMKLTNINGFVDWIKVYNGTEEDMTLVTIPSAGSETPLFNLKNGVTLHYNSSSESPNTFKAVITADCEEIPDSTNMLIMDDNRPAGESYSVNISCSPGFAFQQEEYNYTATLKAVCQEGGVWNWGSESFKRYPKCQVVYCGIPPALRNGYIESMDNVTYNATVVYKCFDGFMMNGTNTSSCQHDGQWSVAGSCQAEDCEKVPDILYGSHIYTLGSGSTHGTIVKYFCHAGYDLIGSEQIVCQLNRTWSDSAPICKKLTCSLPLVRYGYYSTSNWTIDYNESVILQCYGGFKNNRTNATQAALQCNQNRTLNFDDSCIDRDECEEPPSKCNYSNMKCQNSFGSYECVCDEGYNLTNSKCLDIDECNSSSTPICHQQCTNLDGSYNCSCDEGFDLYTANNTNGFILPSGEDGTKPGHVYHINHTCVRKLCDPPASVLNGTVLSKKDIFLYNDTVKFACDFGFQLHGSSLARCTSNRTWSYEDRNELPTCTMIECPVPAKSQLELSRDPPNSSFIKAGESLTILCEQQCENCATITKTLHCAPNRDGHFSLQGDNPHCFAVNCGNISWTKIPGVIEKDIKDTTYGSFFEYECDNSKGYELLGNSSLGNATVMCQRNGLWGFNSLTCQGSYCKPLKTYAGTHQIVQYSYEVGQRVLYNCTRPGYKTVGNDTLICEYNINSRRAEWSGPEPVCKDAEKPEIFCPNIPAFNLYDTLTYSLPNRSDNSGYACLILEFGPPSGVSVVSKNMTLTFTAIDLAGNSKTIPCDVLLKDQKRPWIKCPGTIFYDMGSKTFESVQVQGLIPNITDSKDGSITYIPSELNLTLGEIYNVTAEIMRDNGYYDHCQFLVQPRTRTCSNATLSAPTNGEIKDCTGTNTSMNCSAQCKAGYIYQDLTTAKVYTCSHGTWSTQTPTLPCLKKADTLFYYNLSVQYIMANFAYSPGFNKTMCIESHDQNLTHLVHNLIACNLSEYEIDHLKTIVTGVEIITSSFTLKLKTNKKDDTFIRDCISDLKNSTLFTATYPTIPASLGNCSDPWTVNFNKTEINLGKWTCENGTEMYNNSFCIHCGPGYSYKNGNCTPCPEGTYQELEDSTDCQSCISGKSIWPRTNVKHCIDLCPDGFISPTGFINESCEQCPFNEYSSDNHTFCIPCNLGTLNRYGCSAECGKGFYSSTGYEPCKPCPNNFFSNSTKSTFCYECPSNTYTSKIESQDENECKSELLTNFSTFCIMPGAVTNNCIIKDHRMICECREGYYGDNCSESCDFCLSNPCYNDGQCVSKGLNVTCNCKTAQNCTFVYNRSLEWDYDSPYNYWSLVTDRSECEKQCLKEIQCLAYLYTPLISVANRLCVKYTQLSFTSSGNDYESYLKTCSQESLFDGDYCVNDKTNDCNDNICSKEDFCMDLVNDTLCVCPLDGLYEANCTEKENLCDSNPCDHGMCLEFGTFRYICVCEPGYTGYNCSEDIDDCELNPNGCLYNGTCSDNVNNYTCLCHHGFHGENCHLNPDLCDGNNCHENDGGFCIEDFKNLNHQCVCGENYNLTYNNQTSKCELRDFCLPSPCENGGTCQSNAGSFSCQCTDGFEGSLCQIEIQTEKNETTCDSINVCQSEMKEYFCHLCSSSNVSCVNQSCLEKCRSFNNITSEERFLCQCFCDEPTIENECLLYDPCLHGGTCTNTTNGYNCSCPTGWTGQVCETSVDYCRLNNTCQNNADCYNLIDDTYCHCLNGSGGRNCGKKKDVCENYGNYTCRHGSCVPVGGSAQCACQDSYTGHSCELLSNLCSADPCHGGECHLNESSYYCDCLDGQKDAGAYCNSTLDACSKCPNNSNCTTFTDDNDLHQTACLCPPDKIHSGSLCAEVNKDFDLVFLKDFAIKKQWITSVRGFSLENVTSLTLTMWLAAAKSLNDSDVILSLTSAQKENLLSLHNTRVKLKTTELAFMCPNCALDSNNMWHFIAVTWSQNGSFVLYFDTFKNSAIIIDTLNNIRYATIQLGQGFSGYISNVQLWKSALTAEVISQLYEDKNDVPQSEHLLLDWTYYSFDEKVLMSKTSLAKKNTSICVNISLSALFPLEDICQGYNDDREPPLVQQQCLPEKVLAVDYTQHQISSGQLGYSFTDKDSNLQSTKVQYFSHGAYDIAVAANDSSGNIGVCMTRTFITPNKCEDTKPANYTESCNHSTGVVVVCPDGYLPSVQTPKVLACGQLKTYNLDNMYELPDRIVCGKTAIPSSIQNGNHSCPDGKTLRDKICVECGRGSYFKNETCELCPLNTYSSESGRTECVQCPASLVTLQRGSSSLSDCVVSCSVGQMLNLTSDKCVLCPHNFFQNQSGKHYCFPCPPLHGTYSVGSIHQDNCTEFCPPGTQLNSSGLCEPCPRGTYRVGDKQDQCTSCPENVTTIETGHDQQSDCIIPICPSGMFANQTDGVNYTCEYCDLGFYQPENASMTCIPCNDSYSTIDTGSQSVSQCLFYCKAGYEESPPNSKTCVPCQRGFYRPGDHDNRFKNCSQCPAGNTTVGDKSISLSDCHLKMCRSGYILSRDNSTCEACPYDTYQPEDLPNTTVVCLNCTAGLGTVNVASNLSSDCIEFCAPGQGNNGSCHTCDRGYWNNGNTSMRFQPCQKCPHSFTTDSTGAIDVDLCSLEMCRPGYILSNLTCEACPYDTYQPNDLPNTTTICLNCTKGFGTVSVATNSSTSCIEFCAPGQGNTGTCDLCSQGYWNNGNISMRFEPCQKCPENYTTESTGAIDEKNCSLRACPAGTSIHGDDCKPCEIGYFQPLPYQRSCNECRANTSTSSTGSTSPDDCTIKCPAGEEGISNDTCAPCGDDTFKGEYSFGKCQNCTGDFTSKPSNRTHCTVLYCDFGKEYKNGSCHECEVGHYKNVRGNSDCVKCPLNTSTSSQASTSINDCNVAYCEPGFFSNDNISCIACPIGTYKNETGNQQNQCLPCPPGVTTPDVGNTHIANCTRVSCNAGYYRVNETHCNPCVKGEYQDERDQTQCKICPLVDGRPSSTFNIASTNWTDCYPLCEAGYFTSTNRSCTKCPYGRYKNITDLSTSCQVCPSNFTTVITGATSLLDCKFRICKKGFYRPTSLYIDCVKCPIGTYKNISTVEMTNCDLCPTNQTTLIEGATYQSRYCISNCPGGQGYSWTSQNCTLCPVGQFKEEAALINVCKYCQANYTTLKPGSTSCIQSNALPLAEVKITVRVYILISLGSCYNEQHLRVTISDLITGIVRTARRERYPGLCPTTACSNMIFTMLQMCYHGRKRQATTFSSVQLDLKEIDSPLADYNGTKRNTESAVLELFNYDLLPYEDLMELNELDIVNVSLTRECPPGYTYSSALQRCVLCFAGQFANSSGQCEACREGTYSTNPPSEKCDPCPEGQTTNKTGSQSETDCKGQCYFDTNYCGTSGQCEITSSGVHQCLCSENYMGSQCQQRQSLENSDTMGVVVGVSVAFGAIFFLVLIIFGICLHRRRQPKSTQSTTSDTEVLSHSIPYFNQPIMFENPAMLSDPTMYNAEVMDFYDHDPSVYEKTSRHSRGF